MIVAPLAGVFVHEKEPAWQKLQAAAREGGLRLVERGPRDPERLRRVTGRVAVHPHPPGAATPILADPPPAGKLRLAGAMETGHEDSSYAPRP